MLAEQLVGADLSHAPALVRSKIQPSWVIDVVKRQWECGNPVRPPITTFLRKGARAFLSELPNKLHNPLEAMWRQELPLSVHPTLAQWWDLARRTQGFAQAAPDLGVCRTPSAAGPASGGHQFDVVPGDPDASIMIYRMKSTDAEIKMPQIPSVTSDAKGVALIRDWIMALPNSTCQ